MTCTQLWKWQSRWQQNFQKLQLWLKFRTFSARRGWCSQTSVSSAAHRGRRCWYSSKSVFYTDLFPSPPSVSTWSRLSSETLQFRTQRKHNLMLFIATSLYWFTEFIPRAAQCSLLATEKQLEIRWLDTNFGYNPTRKTPQGWCKLCWTWWWQWRGKQISLANMMSSRSAASCWFSPLT